MKTALLLASLLLAGCAAKVLQDDGRVVTIKHPGGSAGTSDAYKLAMESCSSRGRTAVLVSRSAPPPMESISQFRCE